MNQLVLEFPGMSHNSFYRIYRGRYTISPAGRNFRIMVLSSIPDEFKIVTGPVRVTIKFSFRDRRKRDLDNLTKALLDSLKNRAFEDDSMIYELITSKEIGTENEIKVQVQSLDLSQRAHASSTI